MKIAHLVLMSAFCANQAQAFYLPKQTTKPYDCEVCATLSHENLQDKWDISSAPLNQKVSNQQKSYGYRQQVTLNQLRAGVLVTTLAPGAVLRVAAMQNKPLPALNIKTPAQKKLTLKEASALDSEEADFGNEAITSPHQHIIQLKPELGSGAFLLKSDDQTAPSNETYLISVLDKFSSTYLQVETDSLHYQYGDLLKATISLEDEDYDFSINDIDVNLFGPQGQIIALDIKRLRANTFQATTTLLSELNDRGENWYVEANIQTRSGVEIVRRSGHTAYSYSVPSASLIQVRKLSSRPLTFVATLDVATASRYALQSVLYRKNGGGSASPIETSQKAQWLEPGKHLIQFTFDNQSQFTEDNLYLGYLRLIDYGQLKTVYQYNQPLKLTQLVD